MASYPATLDRATRNRGRASARWTPGVVELKDLPPDLWNDAVVVPPPKRAISLRVDQDALDWFRARGPRYQSRMNAVLRAYMSRMQDT